MEKIKSEYETQAEEFLAKAGATIEAKFLYYGKHFDDDKDMRDVYQITIKRGAKIWRFNFGQCIARSGDAYGPFVNECPPLCLRYRTGTFPCAKHARRRTAPTAYEVLACVTKYDPGTFQNFCGEMGYDTDSRKAEKTYFAVQDEWSNVRNMFGDSIEGLEEIN